MALLVGALLAFAVGLFARASGLDRDRALYPTVEGAVLRLETREREVAAVSDPVQREQLVTLTRRWRDELRRA